LPDENVKDGKAKGGIQIEIKDSDGTTVGEILKPTVTLATSEPDTDNWNQNIVVGTDGLSDGNYTIEIKAIDKVGKSSIEKTISVVIDCEKPTVEISNPDETYVGTSAISGESFVFTGSVTDAKSGPASYSYLLKAKNVAPTENDVWKNSPTGTNWTFTKAIGNADGQLNEGKYTLYVKAKDKAGNESPYVSRNFDVDKAKPVQSLSLNPIKENGIYDDTFSIVGKIYDTHGVEKVDVKILNAKTNAVEYTYASVTNMICAVCHQQET
jgi:hypothetical protein